MRATRRISRHQVQNALRYPVHTYRQATFATLLDLRSRRHPPVIVFQMGKVGSNSIYYALRANYPGTVFHGHIAPRADDDDKHMAKLHKWTMVEQRPLRLITMTREPIGRNISAFFQNFERDTGIPYAEMPDDTAVLTRLFLDNYRHSIPLTWFDRQVLAHMGIDVYAKPFPAEGHETYACGNVSMLLMRAEMDDGEKVRAVSDFLQLPELALQNRNVGSEKVYADIYTRFRAEVRLPSEYIREMCDSRYFRHFYSLSFIEATRRKWLRG